MIKQVAMSEVFKIYKPYWDKVYKDNTESSSPIISTLNFGRKGIANTPFCALYCKSFCVRKPKLVHDFFQVPEEQKITFVGPHLFMINAAPMCHYHSMFLPYFKDKSPQEITKPEPLYLSVDMLKASKDPDLRVLFNSSKAGASMNHLHFHLMITKELGGEDKFPIELCKQGKIELDAAPIIVYKQTKETFIIPHFRLKNTKPLDDKACKLLADTAYSIIEAINKSGKAYNIIIADEGSTLFVVPRNQLESSLLGNGAAECCGVIICINGEVFEEVNKKLIEEHLGKMAISDEELNEIGSIFLKS